MTSINSFKHQFFTFNPSETTAVQVGEVTETGTGKTDTVSSTIISSTTSCQTCSTSGTTTSSTVTSTTTTSSSQSKINKLTDELKKKILQEAKTALKEKSEKWGFNNWKLTDEQIENLYNKLISNSLINSFSGTKEDFEKLHFGSIYATRIA